MTALSFEAENLTWSGAPEASLLVRPAADVLTAGQPVFVTAALDVAACSFSAEQNANAAGIALCNASSDQRVVAAKEGILNFGEAILTVGQIYCVGSNGNIVPYSDLATGNWITILGYAISTTELRLSIQPTGVQKP